MRPTRVEHTVTAFLFSFACRFAVASGADGGGAGVRGAAAAAAAAASRYQRPEPIQKESSDLRRKRSLVIGTPTGGGKYPFLVVVRWDSSIYDPRDAQDIWCQGTMIAPDVVVVSQSCRPDNGYVMVGDSSNGSFVQFRNLTTTDPNHGMISHPSSPFFLFPIEPVSFPGFYPATINKDPDGVYVGQKVTAVGYGITNASDPWSFPGEAYEAEGEVIEFWEDAFNSFTPGVGPCGGDLSVPVLDNSKSMIGISYFSHCGTEPDYSKRIDYVADWIERNACGLSARKEDIPYCPDLVCPSDARLLGYPWALLPNAAGSVVGIRGFDPVRATQWPPPGTPLWRNSTTNVTISAVDATGRKLECVWVVLVAPLVQLGDATIDLPQGSYNTSKQFNRAANAISGRVYKMSGHTNDQISGSGTSYSSRLRKPSGKFTGKPLKLTEKQMKGAVGVPDVLMQFVELNQLSDVEVHVNVTLNEGQNTVNYRVYGQVKEYLF